MDFKITRTCKNCGNTDEYIITKTEAAFSLKNKEIEHTKCTNCDSDKWSAMSYPNPKPDKELLDIWGNDSNLHFMDQDEDIIFAEEENLPLFLDAIDNNLYLKPKLDILVAAICVLAYDNIVSSEEYTAKENEIRKIRADKAITALAKRKHLLTESNWEILDYVKEVVFPLLDIKV